MKKIVEFKDVSRVYKTGEHELKALDNVNMDLEDITNVAVVLKKNLGIATDTSSRTKELISKGLEKQ